MEKLEFKGTKGKWTYSEQQGKPGHCFVAQVFAELSVAEITPRDNQDEATANAKLMAASKDLLKCCLDFVEKVDSGKARSTKSYAQMNKAIKKALL